MKKIFCLLLSVICLTACIDDDYPENNNENGGSVVISNDLIRGDWLCYDEEYGQSAIELDFKESVLWLTTYVADPTNGIVISDSTAYMYYIDAKKNFIKNQIGYRTLHLTLIDADSYKLILKWGYKKDTYYKIVGTYYVEKGETVTVDLSNINFKAIEYFSISPNIATVDESGTIAIKQTGTTFVIAKDSKSNKVVIKLEVVSYVETHASEINRDIETIYKTYGQPDIEQVQDNGSTAILYKNQSIDKSASKIQFNYNSTSRKVTRVLVLYQSRETYLKDAEYMPSVFHTVEFGDYYFCDTDDFYSSTFHILPFEQGGSCYASYGSTSQLILYGHY